MNDQPQVKEDRTIKAFEAVTAALWELPDGERERVLRATAVLLGYDFIEEERVRRRR